MPGNTNKVDYYSKHYSGAHYKTMRLTHLMTLLKQNLLYLGQISLNLKPIGKSP